MQAITYCNQVREILIKKWGTSIDVSLIKSEDLIAGIVLLTRIAFKAVFHKPLETETVNNKVSGEFPLDTERLNIDIDKIKAFVKERASV